MSQKTSTFYFLNNCQKLTDCHDFLAREIVRKFDMNILQIVHLDLSDVATVSWEIEKSNVNNHKYVWIILLKIISQENNL